MSKKNLLPILLFASILPLFALPAEAQCTRWDVNGEWDVVISDLGNQKHRLEVVQTGGGSVSGEARGFYGAGIGEILGTLKGDELTFSINWKSAVPLLPNKANTEAFKGKIRADGKIEGGAVLLSDKTFDFNNHNWTSSRPMKCLDKFDPTHKLKVKPLPPPGAESKAPGPPEEAKLPDPPYIFAAPNVVTLKPGELIGHTTLIWDAGPDHPYAEVWLKINDADEKFVLEKGKGQLAVDLTKGRTYTYILTDSGKTLATVSLLAQ